MQIDQDPGDYRVQARDGSWETPLNKPLCRVMAFLMLGMFVWFTASYVQSEGPLLYPVLFCAMGFFIGGLFTLSLKKLNW